MYAYEWVRMIGMHKFCLVQIGDLLTGCSAKNMPNLRNLAMELRKVCCHPVRLVPSCPRTTYMCMSQILHAVDSTLSCCD